MKAVELRKEFPVLDDRNVCGKPLVYFDNAATSQRPKSVVAMQQDMAANHNANIHRAVHTLSAEATDAYESARNAAQKFLGAQSRQEIIFTSGATAAINLVAYSFGERFISQGDEIVVGVAEHHSNFVPWQQLALRKGAKLKYLYPNELGLYTASALESLLTPSTKLVCFTHASNVLGIINPVKELVAVCHDHGVPVLVDGAQGAVHCKVDVRDLDCDFYAFSAHKLFGPTGVGVLYGKQQWLEQMLPFLCGGEMVGTVSVEGTTFAPLPMKFEAGTQNFNSVAALVPALELMDKVLTDKELNEEFEQTVSLLETELRKVDGLHIFGDISDTQDGVQKPGQEIYVLDRKLPVFSFTIDGVHHEDLAILLDKMGVAVRSGQMCAEPLMTHCGVTGMLRVSLLPYNTRKEVESFIKSLHRAVNMLRG